MPVTEKWRSILQVGGCYFGMICASYLAIAVIAAYLSVNPLFGITLADVVLHRPPGISLVFTTREFVAILTVLSALCCLPLTWWYLRRSHSVKRLWTFNVTLNVVLFLLAKATQAIRYQLYEWNILHTACCAFLIPLLGLLVYPTAYLIVYQRGLHRVRQRVTT